MAHLPSHSVHLAVSANSCPSSVPATCNKHNIQQERKTSLHNSDINLFQKPCTAHTAQSFKSDQKMWKERDHSGDTGIDGRIKLKWTLEG
jgi:hypothetical protein